jgi:hypothetical protein
VQLGLVFIEIRLVVLSTPQQQWNETITINLNGKALGQIGTSKWIIRLDSTKDEENFTIFKRQNPTYHQKVIIILVSHIIVIVVWFTTTPNDVPTLQRRSMTVTTHPGVHLYMPEVGEKEQIELKEYTWSKCQFPVEILNMCTNLNHFQYRTYWLFSSSGQRGVIQLVLCLAFTTGHWVLDLLMMGLVDKQLLEWTGNSGRWLVVHESKLWRYSGGTVDIKYQGSLKGLVE